MTLRASPFAWMASRMDILARNQPMTAAQRLEQATLAYLVILLAGSHHGHENPSLAALWPTFSGSEPRIQAKLRRLAPAHLKRVHIL